MATVPEVISTLQQRGVILKVVAGSLKISGVNNLTDREKADLKAHKGAILKALCQSATIDSEPVVTPAECCTCLRYGPRDRYCGHNLRVISEGEGLICTGKGYSPKGEPWKEFSHDQA